jgi:hypothetical protein
MQSSILEASKALYGVGANERVLANSIADGHLVQRHLAPSPGAPLQGVMGQGVIGGAVPGVLPTPMPFLVNPPSLDEFTPLLQFEKDGATQAQIAGVASEGPVFRRVLWTLVVIFASFVVCGAIWC